MYVDCCTIIDFGRFVIWEFKEVESKKLGIQLNNYIITTIMRQLDGAQTGRVIVFKEEASKGCY
jgi:hypothetical protein